MKIGILTFHYVHNYGAVLQAYALKTYLCSQGHDCSILDYRNKSILREYPSKPVPSFPKKYFLIPKYWKKIYQEIEKCFYTKDNWVKKHKKFELFITEKLLNCEEDNNDWNECAKSCDLIFFGSDQIWEKKIVGKNEQVYYGNFETSAMKASYAASCYDVDAFINGNNVKYIENFDIVSTREKKLADALKRKYPQKEFFTVLDPVFLLPAEEYLKIAKKRYDNYTFVYFVSENDELSRICEYLRSVLNKTVIELHYFNTKSIRNEWQITDVGPEEFLGLIINANEVITNSFHGTAFSLIFKKQFWTLSNNIRITDILSRFSMNDRIISSYDDWDNKKDIVIDYSLFEGKCDEITTDSKEYITNVLRKVNKE